MLTCENTESKERMSSHTALEDLSGHGGGLSPAGTAQLVRGKVRVVLEERMCARVSIRTAGHERAGWTLARS